MAPIVIETLMAWQPVCPKGDPNLVFPNGKGNIENHSNIHSRVLVPLLIENGIIDGTGNPKFSFHALRHAAASLFIEQNWPPKKIQALLGHSSVNMTMDVYGHLFESPEEDAELFAKMEETLLATGARWAASIRSRLTTRWCSNGKRPTADEWSTLGAKIVPISSQLEQDWRAESHLMLHHLCRGRSFAIA